MTDQTITEWLHAHRDIPPELLQFVRDRLRDDEDTARNTLPADHDHFRNETWEYWESGDRVRVVSHCGCFPADRTEGQPEQALRVLREIAAHRALLDVYQHAMETHDIIGDGLTVLYRAIYALAAIWSGHPDYDESWRTRGAVDDHGVHVKR